MSCQSCRGGNTAYIAPTVYSGPIDCNYTVDQIRSWKDKLICVRDIYANYGMSSQQFNSYLGVVYSITNFPNNPCVFKNELDKINLIIINIINSGVC